MIGFAQHVAPEIDRLVWSISQRIGPDDGQELSRFAADRGPAELNRVYHFGDFLAAGRLTESVAVARSRYRSRKSTLSLLDEWEEVGLIRRNSMRGEEPSWIATAVFSRVIDEMWSVIGRLAHHQWDNHADALQTVVWVTNAVMDVLGADHIVAVAHHSLPDPDDLPARAFKRLVTLRYVRQANHIRAWEAAGLTAAQIVVLTALWHGFTPTEDSTAAEDLAARGLVDADGLTTPGRELRRVIEDETNRLDDDVWQLVDSDRRAHFRAVVHALPGEPPASAGT